MKKIIYIPIVGILVQGCGSSYQLDPQIQKGQNEIYISGIETVVSKKKANVTIRSGSKTYSSEDRPQLLVSVTNKTNRPFNFSTENIRVYVDGKPHKVYTYDELVDEVNTEEIWSQVAAGLAGAARSYNASSSAYKYNYNYNYNPYGTYSYPSTSYTYDYAASQQARDAARAQTDSDMRDIQNRSAQSLAALESTIVRKTTIQPYSTYGGYVTFENIENKQKKHDVTVLVTAAGQEHKFVFNHFKVK